MSRRRLVGAAIAAAVLIGLVVLWVTWPGGDREATHGARASSTAPAATPGGPGADELGRLAESLTSADPSRVTSAVVVPIGAEPDPELASGLAALSDVAFDAASFRPTDGEPDSGTVTVNWRTTDGAEHTQDVLLIRRDGKWQVLAAVIAP